MRADEDSSERETPVLDVIDRYTDTVSNLTKRELEVIDELEIEQI